MFSLKQKEKLEKMKPANYRLLVQDELTKQGHSYSLDTISSVYAGKRNNTIVAKAIVKVFKASDKKSKRVANSLEKAISR